MEKHAAGTPRCTQRGVRMSKSNNSKHFRKACKFIPGGVNSPVRAFKAVGGNPIFVTSGKGSHFTDSDGCKYIDYCCSWGPLILGHAHPKVIKAIKSAADKGTSFGISTPAERKFAARICEAVPSIEKVRLVSSGTEATMSAIRLARGFTGRSKIIKFDGCYHGHADYLLAGAGSGVATLGIPDSAGVPAAFTNETIVLPYNDIKAVDAAFKKHPGEIACIIVEPVAGNMGVTLPADGYLVGLRELCTKNGALLIFDEVITGFRLALGGAQEMFGVMPDLTALGKIIGGGLPVGAYGGRADIMDRVAPLGPVYQAGTLSGNPLATAAGIATLDLLSQKNFYNNLCDRTSSLVDGIGKAAEKAGIAITINQVASLFTVFFTDKKVTDYASAKTADKEKYAAFFTSMLNHGVYFAPSQFEANFVSAAHSKADIENTLRAVRKALKAVAALDFAENGKDTEKPKVAVTKVCVPEANKPAAKKAPARRPAAKKKAPAAKKK